MNRRVCKLGVSERHPASGSRYDATHIRVVYALLDFLGRVSEELRDQGELVDVVLSGKEGPCQVHLCKDTSCAPDIDLVAVLLPCQHDLRRSVPPRYDVAGHVVLLLPREPEVDDFQVAILVYEDVARFEVAVYDASRVDVLQPSLRSSDKTVVSSAGAGTYEDLVGEKLDELVVQRLGLNELV